MCAWRLKSGEASGVGGLGGAMDGSNSVTGAGAFLRQNATRSAGGGSGTASSLFAVPSGLVGRGGNLVVGAGAHDGDDEEDEELYEEEEEDISDSNERGRVQPLPAARSIVPPLQLNNSMNNSSAANFGQARPLASSMAGALLQSAAQQQQQQQQPQGHRGLGAAAAAAAQLRKTPLAGLSRQLFKDADARGRVQEDEDAFDDDDEVDELQPEDRDFVLNTRELFEDVDPELLSEAFVPHEHVVGIIASDTGDEASPVEIEENLSQYSDLMEEIDLYLGNYIEAHHDEFNAAISDFSEMILAVSGSDDTLARLKKDLVLGATSLESHAEQLRVLRVRAAKSLFMRETLQELQDAVGVEAEIRQLVATRHYLRAVQLLQRHRATLQSEAMRQVRATGSLREFMEATLTNLHGHVVDDLLSCVFRQERLAEADAELVTQLMQSDEGESGIGSGDGARGGGGAGAASVSAPSMRQMVQRYWKHSSQRRRHGSAAGGGAGGVQSSAGTGTGNDNATDSDDDDAIGNAGRNAGGAQGRRTRSRHTLAGIIETVADDPNDELLTKDYLKFIPLCVKSLILLDRLDNCHEAFFSRATKCIERFIAHFLRLYDAWRRKIVSGTTLAGSDGGASVRAIKIRAFDLTSDLVSSEEAIATVQARDLRAMLSALFAELEKVVRNADYLVKIVAVARFPFISEFVVQPVPFDAERTSREWDLLDEPLGNRVAQVRDAVALAGREVEESIRRRLAKESAKKRRDDGKGAAVSSADDAEEHGESGAGASATATPSPSLAGTDPYALWDQLREFFSMEKLLQRFIAPTATATPSMRPPLCNSPTTSGDVAAGESAAAAAEPKVELTLRDIIGFVDEAAASTIAKYGEASAGGSGGYTYADKEALREMRQTLVAEITDQMRSGFVGEVTALLQQWDLHVLWSQLNYHVEFVFHVLCDAKEAEDDGDDLVTLIPFLRQRNLVNRVQRTAAILKDAETRSTEDAPTLEKLLSTFQSGTGLLRMMEETGSISFSLVGAVKRAQADIRKANEGQARQYRAMQSDTARLLALSDPRNAVAGAGVTGGVGGAGAGGGGGADGSGSNGGVSGAGAPLVLLNASTLRNWFVFTAMNVLTCYGCAERFCERCGDRVPEFKLLDADESVLGFFKRFARTTYIPTLHAFHSQQLQQLCISMGDTAELAAAAISAQGSGGGGNSSAGSAASTADRPASGANAGSTAATQRTGTAAQQPPKNSASVWPTVTVSGAPYPVLACVHYVGQVLEKVSTIRSVLPAALAEDVERSTSEALTEELAAFLKRKLQLLGRGTIQYRLLNGAFEDAFASLPNRRWQVMCSEANMWDAHRLIDADLYRYYQYSSAQRTSGHEYNRQGPAAMEALSALDRDTDAELDEKVGLIPAEDLCVRDDSSLVALAVLSYSAEWLCDALMRNLWPGARRYDDYMSSCVPGYLFSRQLSLADSPTFAVHDSDGTAHQKVRLSGHLSRLCALAQVALFYLSVEARFLAFCFVPQLRDESYNIVATSASADTFVEAYSRRVSKLYMLLHQHLHPKKIKYTCLTVGKPASELVVLELAHLRDKAISEAGMARLRTDLLVMQTALQLILPTDLDVRGAVSRYFARPAVFVRYIPNRDVVNELLSSGDYRRFTLGECEELIRLVFRQVTGANDDSMARANIELFYKKLRTMDALREGRDGGLEEGRDSSESRSGTATDDGEGEDEEETSSEGVGDAHLVRSPTSSVPQLVSVLPRKVGSGAYRAASPTSPGAAATGAKSTPSAAAAAVAPAVTVAAATAAVPPPLPLAQSTAVLGRGEVAVKSSLAAAAAAAARPPSPGDEEDYDEDDEEEEAEEEAEEAEEETEEEQQVQSVPPARSASLSSPVSRPTATSAATPSAAVRPARPNVPPITIPSRPAAPVAAKKSAPAPAPAAAAEKSSDEYYYEEEDEEDEEDETEETEETEAEEEVGQRQLPVQRR